MVNSLISVIVPVYNTSKYLPKCIDSILDQTHKNIEVFLVDDGSTDDSLNICLNYEKRDNRVKVLSKTNGGQGSARNMALDMAKGDFISFVDSDDYILSDAYEKMLNAMRETDADLAVCFLGIDHGFGRASQKYRFDEIRVYNNEQLMKEYVSGPNIHTGPCNKLYKNKLWGNIRFPETRANEDALILHEVLAGARRAVHMGEALYCAVIRQDSTEHSCVTAHKIECIIQASKNLISFYKEKYPQLVDLVAYKTVNECVNIMRKIYIEFSVFKNRGHLKNMKKMLIYENEKAGEISQTHISLTPAAGKALENFNAFVLESVVLGLRQRLSRFYKKIFKKSI